jgi:hypothetical protein
MRRMVAPGGDDRAALLAQMRRGALEYCVLALLENRERYGFELVQTLSAVDGMVTGEGTIYPLLSRSPSRRRGHHHLARVGERPAAAVLRADGTGPSRADRLPQ